MFMKDVGINSLVQHWNQQRQRAHRAAMSTMIGTTAIPFPPTEITLTGNVMISAEVQAELDPPPPSSPLIRELLFGALVELGEKTTEGNIIIGVLPAYHLFLDELIRDPNAFYKLSPRQFEELIAGRYDQEGWNVVLTPRSGDLGRDVIATRPDYGTIRFIDQVKLYKPDHVVDADAVRSLVGVLAVTEMGASKGVITTSSQFAPGVHTEFAKLIPARLTLRDGDDLRKQLIDR